MGGASEQVFHCSITFLFDVRERPYRFITPSTNLPIARLSADASPGLQRHIGRREDTPFNDSITFPASLYHPLFLMVLAPILSYCYLPAISRCCQGEFRNGRKNPRGNPEKSLLFEKELMVQVVLAFI